MNGKKWDEVADAVKQLAVTMDESARRLAAAFEHRCADEGCPCEDQDEIDDRDGPSNV